jgi:hypothetical protein
MPKPIYHAKVTIQITGNKGVNTCKVVCSGNDDKEIRQSIMNSGRIKINGVEFKNFTIVKYDLIKKVGDSNK